MALAYRASADLTVTNLHSLAASSTFVAGWTSGTIDNTSDLDFDKFLSGSFTCHASNQQAGEIRIYVYTQRKDSTWPDLFSSGTEGTEGTATVHDSEIRDAGMKLLWSSVTDGGASDIYTVPFMSIASLFGGMMPPKCALFVTTTAASSTNASFASSGSILSLTGWKL